MSDASDRWSGSARSRRDTSLDRGRRVGARGHRRRESRAGRSPPSRTARGSRGRAQRRARPSLGRAGRAGRAAPPAARRAPGADRARRARSSPCRPSSPRSRRSCRWIVPSERVTPRSEPVPADPSDRVAPAFVRAPAGVFSARTPATIRRFPSAASAAARRVPAAPETPWPRIDGSVCVSRGRRPRRRARATAEILDIGATPGDPARRDDAVGLPGGETAVAALEPDPLLLVPRRDQERVFERERRFAERRRRPEAERDESSRRYRLSRASPPNQTPRIPSSRRSSRVRRIKPA